MKLSDRPTFLSLSGEFVALLPMPNGELRLLKSGFRPVSTFLQSGSVVPFDELPAQFQAKILESWLHRLPTRLQ